MRVALRAQMEEPDEKDCDDTSVGRCGGAAFAAIVARQQPDRATVSASEKELRALRATGGKFWN
jgi:hypothetical protein